MTPIRLVVGLGNPGLEYRDTRHNAGFWWLERLARQLGVIPARDSKFSGLVARTSLDRREVWLLEPTTFMNRSGQAVGALARFYKIAPEEILIVHDELDLPPGTARLKHGGSATHNGLRDIVPALGSRDFWRLRLGIGHPGDRDAVIDYVLHPPRREEQSLIQEAIERSLAAWPEMAAGRFEAAMLALHTRPAAKPAPGNPTA